MSVTQELGERCVGVEVSRGFLTAVCMDSGGNFVARNRVAVDPREPSSVQLIAFINTLSSTFPAFERIGVAVPGLIAKGGEKVAYSVHIPEHSGLDIAGLVTASTGKAAIVENDANAAGYGEFHLGAGRGSESMFYATLGVGVGGCTILGGRIWRGASGYAGEFGYFPINSEGVRLEEVASAANIIRRVRERFHQDSTSSLVEIRERQLTIADVVNAAEADDDFAKLMLERTGQYIGKCIASVINLLNVDCVVVGGEIMGEQHIILDSVIERASDMTFGPSFAATSIRAGELGENAAAAGAALLAREAGFR